MRSCLLTEVGASCSFPVEALGSGRAGDLHEKGPQLLKFLEAIHARPAYKAALEKGGKENFALKF